MTLPSAADAKGSTSLRLALGQKSRKMKSIAAELNMSNALLIKYKESINILQTELLGAKKKYFEQKRQEKLLELASAARALNSIQQ